MWLRKAALLLIAALAIFAQTITVAYAHEGWFVSQDHHTGEYFSFDWMYALVTAGVIGFAFVVTGVSRSALSLRLRGVFDKGQRLFSKGIEWRIVAFLTGVMLIANAVTGVFVAPNLILPSPGLAIVGAAAQIAIGLMLLSRVSLVVPGLLVLLVALPLAAVSFGPGALLDYVVEFAALSVALILFGMSAGPAMDRRIAARLRIDPLRIMHLPLPIIRIGLGLTFAVLAVNNKLLSPSVSLTFLDQYPFFNFMPYLGFSGFTNPHFVYSAGLVELALGLLLALGIGTRFVAASLVALFATTFAILGPMELTGHLPIIGVAALLLLRGSGSLRPVAVAAGWKSVASRRRSWAAASPTARS